MLSPFNGREAGGEGAKEERCRHPKRELCCTATRAVGGIFCLCYHAVHARFGFRLRQSRL